MVAVEVKLWLARLPLDRADWDIQKLADSENDVCNAYFLNFSNSILVGHKWKGIIRNYEDF